MITQFSSLVTHCFVPVIRRDYVIAHTFTTIAAAVKILECIDAPNLYILFLLYSALCSVLNYVYFFLALNTIFVSNAQL